MLFNLTHSYFSGKTNKGKREYRYLHFLFCRNILTSHLLITCVEICRLGGFAKTRERWFSLHTRQSWETSTEPFEFINMAKRPTADHNYMF